MEIRKIIVADYDDDMRVESISRAVRVSTSAIFYRLLEKRQQTGTIEPSYEHIGRQSEVLSAGTGIVPQIPGKVSGFVETANFGCGPSFAGAVLPKRMGGLLQIAV